MRKRKPEDTFDELLKERTIPDDPEMAALARVADRLERGLDAEAPDAYRERTLFIQGVAARKPGFPWGRIFAPMAAAAVLVAFFAISRTAAPGDSLYGVRKALDKVGLAQDPARDADDVMDEAANLVERAEGHLEAERFPSAKLSALRAHDVLFDAEDLLKDADSGRTEARFERLEALQDRASDVLDDARDEQRDRIEERLKERFEEAQEDNSGKGGDDSDDNSGKGSGGDDSDGDDNSGSGGDDSDGDDNSGSGGGDDDSGGDDNSGSGGGGDDSGGGDNSGSGGGGDDND